MKGLQSNCMQKHAFLFSIKSRIIGSFITDLKLKEYMPFSTLLDIHSTENWYFEKFPKELSKTGKGLLKIAIKFYFISGW